MSSGITPKPPTLMCEWYCKGGDNYFWGHYCNELSAAREKLNERYQSESLMPYNNPPAPKQKSGDDRER